MCVVLKMHLMYVLDKKVEEDIARAQANCNMFAWGPSGPGRSHVASSSRCPSGPGRSHLCMYVPCIVCLPAERYAEESEQLTEEVKRGLQKQALQEALGRSYMHMCVCVYLKRADGRGCECNRSANDSSQSVVEKVRKPKQTPVWATCALANTVLIGHRYNSTC